MIEEEALEIMTIYSVANQLKLTLSSGPNDPSYLPITMPPQTL